MKPLEKTFEAISLCEPDQSLRDRILARIATEQHRRESAQRWVSIAGVSMSAIVFLMGSIQHGDSLLQSDFWTLVSLLWSDFGVLAGFFQDFTYSLLETLPMVPIIVLLVPLIIFFWSLGTLLPLLEKRDFGVSHSGILGR